jgi:hypothetical protein
VNTVQLAIYGLGVAPRKRPQSLPDGMSLALCIDSSYNIDIEQTNILLKCRHDLPSLGAS